jgi:hypothetical protein
MKNLRYLPVCVVVLFAVACSDDDANQNAASKKNELSMIVPFADRAGNALLLKDGTLANPKSGIDDFNSRAAGGKLLVSYKTLGTVDGILNIAVTDYSKADDSTFTVEPTSDVDQEIYSKSFSGNYLTFNQDSTNSSSGTVRLSFGDFKNQELTGYDYNFVSGEGATVSGSGKFVLNESTITFQDNEDDEFIVPLGDFQISWSSDSDWLYIWKVGESGEFFSYALKRE